MFDKKKAYAEKMDAQLKEWEAKLEQMQAKVSKETAEAKIEIQRKLDERKREQQAPNPAQSHRLRPIAPKPPRTRARTMNPPLGLRKALPAAHQPNRLLARASGGR